MKRFSICLLMLLFGRVAVAQVDDDFFRQAEREMKSTEEEFQRFRDQINQDFENFRREVNAEYARFMAEVWEEYKVILAEEPPKEPEPPKPVVADPQERPTADPIPFDGTPRRPQPIPQPQPLEPIVPVVNPTEPQQTITLFGTPFAFHFDASRSPSLKRVDESSVADLWTEFSNDTYDNLVAECLRHRKEANLCDWAYFRLTEKLAKSCCSSDNNAAVVLHMYLLTQSGYQTRIGRSGNRLALLFGSSERIYQYKYFVIDGKHFYLYDRSLEGQSMCIFNHAFPKESQLSMDLSQPNLAVVTTSPRTLTSKRYPNVSVSVQTNRNLLDFYSDYPQSSRWECYSAASVSPTLRKDLFPVLESAIQGKTQTDAANILINFTQTAFEYATDQDQFGYERSLFPDETVYYPYSDCEDRAIFFTMLVRELMGLDAVLLHYPGHLAAAVRFTEDVTGDYLIVDGKRYIITDPTYIGANIGRCMPEFKTTQPEVVTFK